MTNNYIRHNNGNYYIRYHNGTAYIYAVTGENPDPEIDICVACCPKSSMSKWEDPNLICNYVGLTHTRPLVNPYYYSDDAPSNEILSLLCGTPPQVNLSSRIEIIIPSDPIFSGTYVFDYLNFLNPPKWILNTALTVTNISSSINTFRRGKNTANYNNVADWDGQDGNVSSVGTNGGPSAYGTYDQNGNVWEWNDLNATQSANKGKRGGAYDSTSSQDLEATTIRFDNIVPSGKFNNLGFRIASSGNFLNLPEMRMVADLNNSANTDGYGSVNYLYYIHKYPVTVNEWVNFLNSNAATDTYGLYNSNMKITRAGSSGSYTYTAMANYGNKPITNVSWFDIARYCNWYHNSRSNNSTETGAYTLGGLTSGSGLAKNAGAKYYIPSENEWYKAAYYAGGALDGTSDGYHEFATQKSIFFAPDTISDVDASGNGPYLTRNNTSNEYLITLTDTDDEATYQGYIEIARSGDSSSNISGVYAFPSTLVFTAIQPPNDAVLYSTFGNSAGGSVGPFPTGTGYRAVVGFKLPIMWRESYNDFIVVDQTDTMISGVANAPSGYATSFIEATGIGLSGTIPETYDLTDTTTAITGVCTGIGYPGFAYKTSASGIPFNNTAYSINISGFNGSRPEFNKYSITKNSVSYDLNTTRLFDNKTGIEAIVNYVFSCRNNVAPCNAFDSILDTSILPPNTGHTTINGSCFGSIINADYACSVAIARPQQSYFFNAGELAIRPIYSGVPQNYYPCVKNGSSFGNVYKAGSGQFISIDYNSTIAGGAEHDADVFRNWINNNFSFVTLDNSDNIIRRVPGVDIYWQIEPNTDSMLALLIPAFGLELSCPVIIVTSVNNISYWNTGWSVNANRSEFTGNYLYDSTTNRYINIESSDQSIQIRFFDNQWNMGKVNGTSFDVYYILQYVSGGIPPEFFTAVYNGDAEDYNDYSDDASSIASSLTWGQSQLPVNCSTNPIGQWSAGPFGVGNATSFKSPRRYKYLNSACCGSGPPYQFPTP